MPATSQRGPDDRFAALEINGLRYLHLAIYADEAYQSP